MKKNIKIAIYSGVVPSTTFIERLIDGLSDAGLHILLFGNRKIKKSSHKNIHYYTYTGKFSKLFQLIKYDVLLTIFKLEDKRKLDKIIDSKKGNTNLLKIKYYPVLFHCPAIFHLQWAKSVEDWMWVQEFGMKLILSLRGTHITISPIGNSCWKSLYSKYFPDLNGFHSVSKSMAIEAEKYKAAPSKVRTIYNGLDLKQFPFNSDFKQNTALKIISIGRSHWVKGYDDALKSMDILNNQGLSYHYTIVGVENNEELLFLRSELNLKGNVTFIKENSFKEVARLIQEADVLLLSSVEEGIANVVLEAMALGTIVVSTNCGGMDEILLDTKNGFLVPIRNPSAMAEALQKVSRLTLEEYQNIIKEARSAVEQQHNVKKTINQMEDFYQKIIIEKK